MSTLRLGVAFALTSCFWIALCQQTTPDPALYESFFLQIAQFSDVSAPAYLNGKPLLPPAPPSPVMVNGALNVAWKQLAPKEAIGLTDHEAQTLKQVASDCIATVHSLEPAIDRLVFEARLERIRTDGTPTWVVQQLNDLESERNQAVLDHVQQLKAAFGDARFDVLDNWVRARKGTVSFFPLLPADKPDPSEKKQ